MIAISALLIYQLTSFAAYIYFNLMIQPPIPSIVRLVLKNIVTASIIWCIDMLALLRLVLSLLGSIAIPDGIKLGGVDMIDL